MAPLDPCVARLGVAARMRPEAPNLELDEHHCGLAGLQLERLGGGGHGCVSEWEGMEESDCTNTRRDGRDEQQRLLQQYALRWKSDRSPADALPRQAGSRNHAHAVIAHTNAHQPAQKSRVAS